MTVAAGHLDRPRSQLGGPVSPARFPHLPPALHIVLQNSGPAPILSSLQHPPNIGVCYCYSCAAHPPLRSALPPLHSALCSSRASPIPPHVVLISTQRPSVKTTNYVDTRAEFTQKTHTLSLHYDLCVFRFDIIPSSLALQHFSSGSSEICANILVFG